VTNLLTITTDERFQEWGNRHWEDLNDEWAELEDTQ